MTAGASDGDSAAHQLERLLLGGGSRYTKFEVADRAGVPLERADRLWSAMGFAIAGDDAAVFTDDDIAALRLHNSLVETGVVEAGAEASVIRAVGQALARLADWETSLVREFSARSDDQPVTEEEMVAVTETLLPVMERLQAYVWRRHLLAAACRQLPVSAGDTGSARFVVGFADIVGFTRFSRTASEAELRALVDRFGEQAGKVVAVHGGRVVKMIGDEVLFVTDTPCAGAHIALELVGEHGNDPAFPELRIGLAYGHVLDRLGDVYGPVVNVAARLTSLARPGTVLVDHELRTALDGQPAYDLRRLHRVSVRGYRHLQPWALRAGRDVPGGAT